MASPTSWMTLRAVLAVASVALLSACLGQSTPPPSGGSATTIHVDGGVKADLVGQSQVGGSCSVSAFGTGAATVSTFVYNGATSEGGAYVLIFSIFPYHGAGTYPLTAGGRTQIQLITNGQGPLLSSGGNIVVKASSSGSASGTLDAQLQAALPAQETSHASGTWHCSVSAPSPVSSG